MHPEQVQYIYEEDRPSAGAVPKYASVIFKYAVPIKDEFTIDFPTYARILTVQVQHGVPCLWAVVGADPGPGHGVRVWFRLVGTGVTGGLGEYVGTFQLEGGALVFHLFRGKAENIL